MSGKRKEPAVISMALIQSALEDGAAEHTLPEGAVPRPAVNMAEADALQLSFKNILRIENLHLLKSLKTLRLDNNHITKIEALGSLHNLEWLDLSFNKIKVIEGLESLVRLRDLSLYNNEIASPIGDGLDGLSSLQCLSLGNNHLTDLHSVLDFRRLPKLEALSLEGNPLCRPPEGAGANARDAYRVFCHAFLPRLRYLDFQLITAAEKASARDGGVPADKLQEVEEKDAAEEKVRLRARERAELIGRLSAANLEVIETFPEELLEEDLDYAKIRGMAGVATLLQAFRDALVQPGADLRQLGMDKDGLIRAEIAQYEEALASTVGDALAGSAARMAEWERSFKHAAREHARLLDADERGGKDSSVFTGAGAGADGSQADDPVAHAAGALHALASDVGAFESWALRSELAAHEAVEAMLDVFDTAMGELRAAKVANHETFFRAAEAAEGVFSEGLAKQAERSVADAAAGRLPPDADEDLASLLGDKEALLGSLAQSHEGRVAKILRREGELKAREERRCGGAVTAARRAELARNRQRIEEIKGIAASGRKRVEGALSRADTWGEHGHHGHHGHHGGDHGHGGAHAQHPAHGHGHFSVMHKA